MPPTPSSDSTRYGPNCANHDRRIIVHELGNRLVDRPINQHRLLDVGQHRFHLTSQGRIISTGLADERQSLVGLEEDSGLEYGGHALPVNVYLAQSLSTFSEKEVPKRQPGDTRMHRSSDVTALLKAWRGGDQTALERLTPLVYDHLRKLGRQYVRRERAGGRADATSLVHDAYVRPHGGLAGPRPLFRGLLDDHAANSRRCRARPRLHEETAEALGVSPQTVLRDWKLAQAWLAVELRNSSRP